MSNLEWYPCKPDPSYVGYGLGIEGIWHSFELTTGYNWWLLVVSRFPMVPPNWSTLRWWFPFVRAVPAVVSSDFGGSIYHGQGMIERQGGPDSIVARFHCKFEHIFMMNRLGHCRIPGKSWKSRSLVNCIVLFFGFSVETSFQKRGCERCCNWSFHVPVQRLVDITDHSRFLPNDILLWTERTLYTHTHTRIESYIYIYTHVYIYIYYVYIYIMYIYIYTHTCRIKYHVSTVCYIMYEHKSHFMYLLYDVQ